MRLAYVGNFRFPYCTEIHLAWTFEHLGVQVVRLQEDRMTPETIEAAALDAEVDAVVYTMTPPGLPHTLTDVWRRLEGRGIVTTSYHLDLYLGLRRASTLTNGDPFWTTSVVFTPDGDPASAETFEKYGIDHRWQPPAIVEYECHPGTPLASYAHDVVFVGSEHYHEEWPHRPELIRFLRGRYGPRFRRYGVGTQVIRGPHLNDLYASAKVVVGDSLCPGYTHANYWSDRCYETLGRGGFLLHPRVPGLEAHLTDREHLVFYDYGDFDALGMLIDEYLERPDERARIAEAGQRHVAEHHTYTHRVRDILPLLERTVP